MSGPAPAIRRERKPRVTRVERIKREKPPLRLLSEIDALAGTPYEEIHEDDILRLQWLGLYHDKPRTGEFMLRVKLPGGVITAGQLRALGELSVRHGKGTAELTTRQDVQVHRIELPALPKVFAHLAGHGLSSAGACGAVLRNITSCPVSDIDPAAPFDVRPVVRSLAERFGGEATANLPRKHKWTVSACPAWCNAPEIHDVGLVGVRRDRDGFAVLVGGGLSTVPRLARSLGVFVTEGELPELLGELLDIWRGDPRYRRSRGRSRFKFMVEDLGVGRLREMVEERLGRPLEDLDEEPSAGPRSSHLGVHRQRQPGLSWIGFGITAGLVSGQQLLEVAEVADEHASDVRLTREQNLVVAGVPDDRVDVVLERMAAAGIPIGGPLDGHSIACTGNPFCNFAVGDTKPRLTSLVRHLESRYGDAVGDLRIHLDGCPHACGQHWVGDIGLQGTLRRTDDGRIQAYDILLRGGLGPDAAIGRAVLRKVPAEVLEAHLDRLIDAYLARREPGQGLAGFCAARDDDTLRAIVEGGA